MCADNSKHEDTSLVAVDINTDGHAFNIIYYFYWSHEQTRVSSLLI